MEEENEEEMAEDHGHRTEVPDHQMGEGRGDDAAGNVVVDMVAAWLLPPGNAINQ